MLFSIVIPAHQRPEALYNCLSAIAELQFEGDFEVVVVDDGSEPPLAPICERFGARLSLRTVLQPNLGPGPARNTGSALATGRFVAFVDDDCRVHPAWLTALHTRLEEHPEVMVGGSTRNVVLESLWSAASQHLISYLYEYYNADPQEATFVASNNMALSRQCFLELGGFLDYPVKAAGEDRDLCERWRMSGRRIMIEPEARVDHAHRMDCRRFLSVHFNYGRGAYHFHRLSADRRNSRVQFEPLGFYSRLLVDLTREGYLLAGVLSQFATAGGYLWEWFLTRLSRSSTTHRETGSKPALRSHREEP